MFIFFTYRYNHIYKSSRNMVAESIAGWVSYLYELYWNKTKLDLYFNDSNGDQVRVFIKRKY